MPKVLKFLTTLLILTLLAFGYYSLFYAVSLTKISSVEKYLINTGLDVIEAGTTRRARQLEVLANDWSYWDASYNFMSGTNPQFIEDLTEESLINMGVNMLLFYNTQGTLIYKATAKSNEYQEVVVPGELLDEREENSLKPLILETSKKKESNKGFIDTPNGDLIFATAPILQDDGAGPSHGTILFGRYLDDEDVDLIRVGVNLDLNIHDYVNVPADIEKKLSKNDYMYQRRPDTLVGYKVFRDYFNEPAFYIEFFFPSIVYDSWCYLLRILAAIAAAGTMFSGSFFLKYCKKKTKAS